MEMKKITRTVRLPVGVDPKNVAAYIEARIDQVFAEESGRWVEAELGRLLRGAGGPEPTGVL